MPLWLDSFNISLVSSRRFIVLHILTILIVTALKDSVLQDILLILMFSRRLALSLVFLMQVMLYLRLWPWKICYLWSEPLVLRIHSSLSLHINSVLACFFRLISPCLIQLALRESIHLILVSLLILNSLLRALPFIFGLDTLPLYWLSTYAASCIVVITSQINLAVKQASCVLGSWIDCFASNASSSTHNWLSIWCWRSLSHAKGI